jgi:hypothetical protein
VKGEASCSLLDDIDVLVIRLVHRQQSRISQRLRFILESMSSSYRQMLEELVGFLALVALD